MILDRSFVGLFLKEGILRIEFYSYYKLQCTQVLDFVFFLEVRIVQGRKYSPISSAEEENHFNRVGQFFYSVI